MGHISTFIKRNFRHFNAATLVNAAQAAKELIEKKDGKLFITLAGAMSTGELGISLAAMIREGHVAAICCTGANLEEDVFNLVAHEQYVMVPNYRDLTPAHEKQYYEKELYRVTDTLIPEKAAMLKVEKLVMAELEEADKKGYSLFPHEILCRILLSGDLEKSYQIDPRDSWMLAAAKKKLPIFVPGWEDSTLGNMYAARVFDRTIKNVHTVRGGIEYMLNLVTWYSEQAEQKRPIGFFQVGGGIAGDFSICVVPVLREDLQERKTPLWAYFCQISDSTTSYGSYSGAVPNEKITWSKLDIATPKFIIESDASIVAPLMFAYIMEW